MTENDTPTKLLWVDLEMTGLNPENQKIIEVAAIVTDFDFNELGRYEAIINHPESVFESAEDWPKQHMSALFDEARNSVRTEGNVREELVDFIKQHFGDEPAVLAGNSIHQDRRFIRQWWPDVDTVLHYRMFDVSTFKIWIQGKTTERYEKKEAHRAMGDIEESIEELKWSLSKLN